MKHLILITGLLVSCGQPADSDLPTPDAEVLAPPVPGVPLVFSGQQKLLPTQNGVGLMGHAVAIDGNTLVAGALLDGQQNAEAGAAYVFVKSGSTWAFQQKLLGDGNVKDRFGKVVDISGDTVVVGVPVGGNADAVQNRPGSVHVFVRSGTTWSLQQKITPSDSAINDRFGQTVRISGDRLIVSKYKDASLKGAVYIYERSGTTWGNEVKLTASDGVAGDEFGYFVDIDGGVAAVGARKANGNKGAVYVFDRVALGNWTEVQELIGSDVGGGEFFGRSLALSGGTLLVSAMRQASFRGAAYVFQFDGTTWAQQQKLTASDGAAGDEYGRMVALEGNVAVIGALRDDIGANSNQGSVYVYKRTGTTWSEDQKIVASDGQAADEFGKDVAISGRNIVIGAHLDDDVAGNAGAAYTFEQPPVVINGGDFGGTDLIPNDGDTLNGTFTNVGTFHVKSGRTVLVQSGVTLDVSATTTIIDGVLDANGAGFAGGAQTPSPPANGSPGQGLGAGNGGEAGPCVHGGGGGGGGYGGAGGTGGYVFNNGSGIYPNGGGIYGADFDTTIERGSGGGGGGSSCSPPATNFGAAGGAGGGAIRITSTSIAINGTVTANGITGGFAPSDAGAGGGGSGGGIVLLANSLTGAGVVSAKGGNGGSETNTGFEGDGGGGGGGKIKLSAPPPFTTAVTGGAAGGPCTGGSFSCPANGAIGKLLVLGLTPNPTSIGFGTQLVGTTSSAQNVQLTNNGVNSVTITSITTAAPFAVTGPTLPVTLAAGESTLVAATFTPTSTGAANGSISVVSNDPSSPHSISLSGTGVQPQLTTNPVPGSTINFGNQRVGTTGNQNVVITNTGTATLNVNNFATTGTFSSNGTASAIAPGNSKTVVVSFTPTAAGPAGGTLSFTSDDPANPTASYTLAGIGIEPVIAVTPSPVAFGNQRINTTGNRVLTVSNTGTDKLTITALAVTGAGYATTQGVPLVVDPGSSVGIALTFTPAALGSSPGNIAITSDAANGPTTNVPLSGAGVAPAITVDQTAIDFGNQRLNTTGVRTLKVTNTGDDTLNVTAVTTAAPFGDDATSFSLAPNVTRDITVTFTPTVLGLASTNLTITSDANNGTTTIVDLDGTGVAPAIAVAPSPLAFDDQRVGTTGTKTLLVTNTGSDVLTISSITTAAPFANNDTTPIQITPGNSTTLTVTFTPSATVSSAEDLVIVSDALTSPTTVPLTGTGIAPDIAVGAASIDFGGQRVGTRGVRQLTIANTGSDTLTISAIASNNGVFSPDTAGPLVIAAGNQVQLNVNFDPADVGLASATLTLTSDAASSPTEVALTGTGIAPAIDTSPGALDFGFQRIDEVSTARQIVVTNTGTDALVISNITIAPPFTITAPASFPVSIEPTETLTIELTFLPAVTGNAVQQLAITSDAATSPTLLDISGIGVLPGLAASTTTLGFGTIKVGTESAGQVVQLTNTSVVKAVITSVDVPTGFVVEGVSLPVSLLPNASVPMTVKFKPTSDGVVSGTLTFVSDAETVPMIQLDGTGGTPALVADPGTIDFGQVPIDTTSDPIALTIRNTGASALVVTAIGATAPFVRASIQLPLTIEPGAAVPLNVMFRPTAEGGASGTITITSDGGTSVIPLTGEGLTLAAPDDGGCCSSSGDVGSAWLGLGVLALVFRPRRRRR